MHRLVWKRNTLPCALSILNLRISAEVCLLGHQWISRGFAIRTVHYHQYTRSQKIHWGRLANLIFPEKRSLDVSLGPYRETSVSKIPTPPPKKNLISFRTGQAYSIFRDDRSTTLSTRMGLF